MSESVTYLSPHSYLVRLTSKGMFCQYSLSEQKIMEINYFILVNNFFDLIPKLCIHEAEFENETNALIIFVACSDILFSELFSNEPTSKL